MRLLISILTVFIPIGGLAIVHLVTYCLAPSVALRLNRWTSTVFASRIFSIMGAYLDFHYKGETSSKKALPHQYLLIANHQGLLDIPLLMRFLDGSRLRFVAKEELGRHVPLVSRILTTDRHCLVPRTGGATKAMRCIDDFARRVAASDQLPVIFPEGTRSKDGELGTFHAAGFRRFLDHCPLPVAVCAIDGGWRIGSLDGIARRMRGGTYRVEILKIYPAPHGKEEQVRILEEGKSLISAKLAEWRSNE
jgi:1-acyl-sn-glycerol-3-phosphate acyltransferase